MTWVVPEPIVPPAKYRDRVKSDVGGITLESAGTEKLEIWCDCVSYDFNRDQVARLRDSLTAWLAGPNL